MISESLREPGPVLRVRINRKNGEWKILKRIHIPEKTLPSSDDLPAPGKAGRWGGFWFEAVDKNGDVLYRQVLYPPRRAVEVFEEDGSIRRISVKTDEYTTDLLIPDLPEIESVKLFLEEPEQIPEREKALMVLALEPIAVFPMREGSPGKGRRTGGKHHGHS